MAKILIVDDIPANREYPVTFQNQLIAIVQKIEDFWFSIVRLPLDE